MIDRLARSIERLLLPNACVACGGLVGRPDPDALLCRVCLARARPLAPGGCCRCAQPLPPVGPCRFCRDWPEQLARVRSAAWLGPETRALIHHLKYHARPRLALAAATLIAGRIPPPRSSTGCVLIPVPTTPERVRRRGYDQARLIAAALGRHWRLPTVDILQRSRERGSQTALTPAARLANVAGAYQARTPARPDLEALLVDDVLTTGATLDAAARALVAAGWRRLGAVTVARAEPYERVIVGHRTCGPRRPSQN